MAEDGVWCVEIAAVTGAGMGSIVERNYPALGRPVRRQSPRVVLFSVAVAVWVVGVPVSSSRVPRIVGGAEGSKLSVL